MRTSTGPQNRVMGTKRTDIMSPKARSALMARIRSVNTRPELVVRRLLHGLGYRYRLHAKNLPGRPDIVFPSRKAAIFVHGCFWHRHDCGQAYLPKSRQDFWQDKFKRNIERDRENQRALLIGGWKILIIWECEIGSTIALTGRLSRFLGPPR